MNRLNIKIETERLLLVPTSLKYADEIFKEFTPEVTEFMSPMPPEKIEDTYTFIRESRKKMKEGKELILVILNRKSMEFIGHCGIHKIDTSKPTIGIWIKKRSQKKGYGKEAVLALKNWISDNIDYEHIRYQVDVKNDNSRKLAEYLGGVIGKQYKRKNQSGRIVDALEYWISPK